MVQLRILSGAKAGGFQAVRHFPFNVGRATDNDLCFDAAGVWDHHFILNLQKKEGFTLQVCEQTFVAINDHPQSTARLRNGDVISFGSAKVQFWLSDPKQRGLWAREMFVWVLIACVTIAQIALIYFLLGLN